MRKPVIFTEFGWPGVGHKDPSGNPRRPPFTDPIPNADTTDSLYEDDTTRQAAANVIKNMIPQAYSTKLVMGVMYFEFSDEWWKQPPYELSPGDTSRAASWNPGPFDGGMPNGFHDQEGFGLYSTKLGAGRTDPNQPPVANNQPVTPVDPYIARDVMVQALKDAYAAVNSTVKN